MDDFLTVYRYDYVPKTIGEQFRVKKQNQRTNTINEDYTFKTSSEDMKEDERKTPIQLANEFLNDTFKHQHPKLYDRYFKEPISEEIASEFNRKSVYTNDYCKYRIKSKDTENQEGSGFNVIFRETTNANAYRPPLEYGDFIPAVLAKPLSHGLRETHKAVTSIMKQDYVTEYHKLIGITGKHIIETEPYGKITYPEIGL